MRLALASALLSSSAVLAHSMAAGHLQPPIYRAATDLVRIVATVSDADGNPVTDLSQQDFRIAEDGAPQDIALFTRDADTPLSIVLVVDVSRSMADELDAVRHGLRGFLGTLRPQDEVGLVSFGSRVRTLVGIHEARERLITALSELTRGSGTALYKGIVEGVGVVTGGSHQKKVIVLVTDGNNTSRSSSRRSATRTVERSEVLLYSMGIGHSNRPTRLGRLIGKLNGPQMGLLGQFATTSGGRAELVDDLNGGGEDRFVSLLTRFGEELRRQYTLGYYPPEPAAKGKLRQVRVTTASPQYIVRARRVYVGR